MCGEFLPRTYNAMRLFGYDRDALVGFDVFHCEIRAIADVQFCEVVACTDEVSQIWAIAQIQ